MRMDAKAAAAAIASDVDPNHGDKMPPEGHHTLAFITDVAGHLGMKPSAANLSHIAQVLTLHGIDQHIADEFPKWLEVHPVEHQDIDYLHTAVGPARTHLVREGKVVKAVHVMFDDAAHIDKFMEDHGHVWEVKNV